MVIFLSTIHSQKTLQACYLILSPSNPLNQYMKITNQSNVSDYILKENGWVFGIFYKQINIIGTLQYTIQGSIKLTYIYSKMTDLKSRLKISLWIRKVRNLPHYVYRRCHSRSYVTLSLDFLRHFKH